MKKKSTEEKNSWAWCCTSKKGFPTFSVILLVIATLWLLSELEVITSNVPWLPVILIVLALGLIINRYHP